MKVIVVEGESAEKAQLKLREDLGVPSTDIRLLDSQDKKFSFQVLSCPAQIEVEISRSGMQAIWKKLSLPIGDNAPKLNTDFVVELLAKKGVKAGIKHEVISKELFRILKTPGFDENVPLNIVVATGIEPTPAQAGRPQWVLNMKLFEKKDPIFAKKGEIVARAPHAVPGQDGMKVTGELIPAPVDEQFRLNTGQGIETQKTAKEILYVVKAFGQLKYDEGVRLRLETKIIDLEDGLKAAILVGKETFTGSSITAEDLIQTAKDQNVVFGHIDVATLEQTLKNTKKWPAQIVVAVGEEPRDGRAGEVKLPWKRPASDREIDQLKAQNQIVFPGEVVAIISSSIEPKNGKTVYGEVLRGRANNELPIYPGKNVIKEKVRDEFVLKSTIYGKVAMEQDRISVQSIVQINADGMEASIDLFPQQRITGADIQTLLREADVLFGFEKEAVDKALSEAFVKAQRIENFVVARGRPYRPGTNAKIVLNFSPEVLKDKGVFQVKKGRSLLAAPGDLLMTKILPVEAEDGQNVYREKIPVPGQYEAKDIQIDSGKNVDEVDAGVEGDLMNPKRIEYRSAILGILVYKDRSVDIKPAIQFDEEKIAYCEIAPMSDFKKPITKEMILKAAAEEGIRVNLELTEIEKALKEPRSSEDPLNRIVIARAIAAKDGADAKLEYLVEFNGKNMNQLLTGKRQDEAPLICDCVRTGEVLGTKTAPGRGEDGKSIFGRRLVAQRGLDEPWLIGDGVDKSPDGMQLIASLRSPGFVMIENSRVCVRNTVRIARDKMSAIMTIYPSNNTRYQPTLDKLMAMITAAGVRFGIKKPEIEAALERVLEEKKPAVDLVIAEGKPASKGKNASYFYAIDTGEAVGEMRKDGSVDFRSKSVYQNIRQGQLLLVKRPATLGQEGMDVLGQVIPSTYGEDVRIDAGVGVDISETGLEFRAARDGIVEISPSRIQVIPGLLVPENVDFKTGNINGGAAQVFIRGAVLPDFTVTSDKEITIEKVAEACRIISKDAIRIRGGIIGRNKGYVSAGTNLEALYVQAGAVVEAKNDVSIGSEITNSTIRVGGFLNCFTGAGTIYGGEISVYAGLKARVVGAPGSETQTVIRLGESFFARKEAEDYIKSEGIPEKLADLDGRIQKLNKELKVIYDQIPEMTKKDLTKSLELQEQYKVLFNQKRDLAANIDRLNRQKEAIYSEIPRNKDVVMTVLDLIHPGVTIIYKDVVWVLKEPLKGVEIRWNTATSNLVSKRI